MQLTGFLTVRGGCVTAFATGTRDLAAVHAEQDAERSRGERHRTQRNREPVPGLLWRGGEQDGLSHGYGAPSELSGSNKDSRSCDEYSFNATYQSAGMPTTEGGKNPRPVSDALQGRECVQTYEKKLPDGTYRLYDDERYAAPTWDETCGRSSMSLNVNSLSVSRFGSFASTFRLLDKDTYWVDIDGFQDCDATADVIKCAQRP
ncbi:hypothetical protein AB0L14_11920 [Streptomyces sp. NPDC052727]|uniref:hypothetical protein n=1 Tax=Streptomyces sp. NPDC052727 TaxID=3154854 RepID=UPI0034172C6A